MEDKEEEYQRLTKSQLERIFELLYKEYPKLLRSINFEIGNAEQICGLISQEIAIFLRGLGAEAHYMAGTYRGRGTRFSGGERSTGHCWVEMLVQVKDERYSTLPLRDLTIIIDGAYAQFFPNYFTPNCVKERQRLSVFVDDPKANKWYRGKDEKISSLREAPLLKPVLWGK